MPKAGVFSMLEDDVNSTVSIDRQSTDKIHLKKFGFNCEMPGLVAKDPLSFFSRDTCIIRNSILILTKLCFV